MFTGFMVDASNIMKFQGGGNMTSDVKYSVEFWIFKPKSKTQQVPSDCSNTGCPVKLLILCASHGHGYLKGQELFGDTLYHHTVQGVS